MPPLFPYSERRALSGSQLLAATLGVLGACSTEIALRGTRPSMQVDPAVLRVSSTDGCSLHAIELRGTGNVVDVSWHPTLGELDQVWVPPITSLPVRGSVELEIEICPDDGPLAGVVFFDLADQGEVVTWIEGGLR